MIGSAADLYPDYRAGKDRLRRMAQDAIADGERIRAGTHDRLSMDHALSFFFFHPCIMGRNLDSLIFATQDARVSPVMAIVGMPYAPPLIFGPACPDVASATEAAHNMMSLAYAMVLKNRIELDMIPMSRVRFRSGAWLELPDSTIEQMSRGFPQLSLADAARKIDKVRARVREATGQDTGRIDEAHPHWRELRTIAAFAMFYNIGPMI